MNTTVQPHSYLVTMRLNHEEFMTLKAALLAYSKSDAVTLENFDLVRNLYGNLTPAWNARISRK
jgi:hypothetical protein